MSSQIRQRGRPGIRDDGAIIDAVTETFWRSGFAETSIGDLSAASGAARASLYKLYGDKPGLLAAALDRYAGRFDARVDRTLARVTDPVAAVGETLRASADRLADPTAPPGCLRCRTTLELRGVWPTVDAALDRATADFEANMHRLLEADGRSRPEAARTARLLVAVVNGMVVMAVAGADRTALEDVIDGALDVVRAQI